MTNPEDMQNEIYQLEIRCYDLECTVSKLHVLIDGLEKAISALDVKTAPLTEIGSHEPNFNHLGALRLNPDDMIKTIVGGDLPVCPDKYTRQAMEALKVDNLRAAVARDIKIIDGR